MIGLIDGDLIAYRCAASAENEDLEIAIHRANELLDKILLDTEVSEFRVFLTGKDNFRKSIYPEYKAQRTQPKPIHLEAMRHYVIKEWNAEVCDGMEADDGMAINQKFNGTVIISLDKDMLQVPGHHYSWEIAGTSHGKQWVREAKRQVISPIEGQRLFFQQLLKGDPSDNIKGIEGIGEKKAEKMLANCKSEQEMFDIVREAYGNDEEMQMNGRVLWLLRSPEDDWRKHFDEFVQKQVGNRSLEKAKD
jgi:5'-3' exonuclease